MKYVALRACGILVSRSLGSKVWSCGLGAIRFRALEFAVRRSLLEAEADELEEAESTTRTTQGRA